MSAYPPAGTPSPEHHEMRDVVDHAEALWHKMSGRRRAFIDWVLVALVWVSLALNLWLLFATPADATVRSGARYADIAVCVLLALSICVRWLRFRIGWIYLRKHAWEVPALIPLVMPAEGPWHWAMWLVLIARVVRVIDRTDNFWGDKILAALVDHFADPIVETIKRPITVAVLDEVIDVLQEGTYAANAKAALDENREEIEAMVLELVRRDQTTGKLKYLPFHDDIVFLVSETVLRILDGALEDPRTSELISDIIRNSASQIRQAVRTPHRS